jgi:hypothetical protein
VIGLEGQKLLGRTGGRRPRAPPRHFGRLQREGVCGRERERERGREIESERVGVGEREREKEGEREREKER